MKTTIQKLILSLVWLALPMLAQAQFTFTTNNGTITITGYYDAAGLDVVIPAATNGYPVTSIGEEAFGECESLTSVTIPNSVTNIGDYAFANCTSLTSVSISDSVTSIGEGVFGDTALTSVAIPNSVTSIGDEAFVGTPLTSVIIPDSVTNIGYEVFGGTALTSVTIPNSITTIGEYAFADCISLTSVTIPNSVTSIGDGAFDGDALTSLNIPKSVTSIEGLAFADCTNLTSVTIPNSVTIIGSRAFIGCTSLTTAYFPGNAPTEVVGSTFVHDPAIVYYLAGTTGWGPTFGGVPTMLWNPQAHAPGFPGGQFGFNLTGPTNAVIVVEACTNLSNPVWLPVATNTFSASGTSTFTDPSVQPSRFYRFSSP